MGVSGQLHAPAALPPGKELPVPTGSQSQSGRGDEEKNTCPLPAIKRQLYPV
jgi:hypothetical protein